MHTTTHCVGTIMVYFMYCEQMFSDEMAQVCCMFGLNLHIVLSVLHVLVSSAIEDVLVATEPYSFRI